MLFGLQILEGIGPKATVSARFVSELIPTDRLADFQAADSWFGRRIPVGEKKFERKMVLNRHITLGIAVFEEVLRFVASLCRTVRLQRARIRSDPPESLLAAAPRTERDRSTATVERNTSICVWSGTHVCKTSPFVSTKWGRRDKRRSSSPGRTAGQTWQVGRVAVENCRYLNPLRAPKPSC